MKEVFDQCMEKGEENRSMFYLLVSIKQPQQTYKHQVSKPLFQFLGKEGLLIRKVKVIESLKCKLVRIADNTWKVTSEFLSQQYCTAFWRTKVNVLDFGETRFRTCRWTRSICFCRTTKSLFTSDFFKKTLKTQSRS